MCIIERGGSMNYKFTPFTTVLHLYDVLHLLGNNLFCKISKCKDYITIGDMLKATTVFRDTEESSHSNAYHIINEAMQQISFKDLEELYHSHDDVDMSVYQLVSIEEVRYAKSCVRAFSDDIEMCDRKYYSIYELVEDVQKVVANIHKRYGVE